MAQNCDAISGTTNMEAIQPEFEKAQNMTSVNLSLKLVTSQDQQLSLQWKFYTKWIYMQK